MVRRARGERILVPWTTSTGSRTLRKSRALGCGRRPASCSSMTQGAALPSRTGTSGPSSSTRTSSTPRAESAARRCSTVSTETPSTESVVAWSWRPTLREGGGDLDVRVGPDEADAVLGGSGAAARAARACPSEGRSPCRPRRDGAFVGRSWWPATARRW